MLYYFIQEKNRNVSTSKKDTKKNKKKKSLILDNLTEEKVNTLSGIEVCVILYYYSTIV